MAINEDVSFIEYPVDQPTQDFVTNFNTIGGTTDVVLVTVDGVLTDTPESSYTVQQINHNTWRVTPEVQTDSVVRLYRVTNIDEMMHVFTAGAKFIARNMDNNFKQIRHSQQEVRDGFDKLSTDTNEIISTLEDVAQSAQDAADAAEDAAQAANDAAAQVNDKVSYQDLETAVDDKIAAGVDASFIVDGVHTQHEINKIKGINIWDFFTTAEISSYNANPTTFDMTVALQRGIGAATVLNRKIEGYGEFYIADTLIISCACDLLDVQLNTDVTNKTAVQVRMPDYAYMWRKELKLPKVSYKNHVTQDGWPDNAVGIEIINTLSCEIEVPHVRGFHTNLKVTSTLSNCYNNFYLGQLDNGKINLDVTTSPLTEIARPWTNENNFFGGRYSHNGGEGTNVPGVRHIRLYAETSTLNNNVFYKPSIEASVSEYNLELACQYCKFIQPRFESDPPKVLYRKNNALSIADAQAQYNVIDGGYNSDRIVFTREGTGAFRNRLIAPNRELNTLSSTSGGSRYANLSGRTHAVLSVFQPEVDIDTADFSQYSLMLSSAGLRGKRYTDTSDRLFINVYDGAIVFTDGSGSTPVNIARNTIGININATLHSTSTDTYDLGTSTYRYKRLYLSQGLGVFGATPPATKPSIAGKKTPATISEQNAVMDSIVSALVAYGLVSDDRTT